MVQLLSVPLMFLVKCVPPFIFISLSLSLSLSRHLDFMIMELEMAMPTGGKVRRRRRIEVSFGRGSLSLLDYTCFTCLKSHSTRGTTIITTTVIVRYIANNRKRM